MKKLFTILILLVASISFAAEPVQLAKMNMGMMGGGGAASCTRATTQQSEVSNDSGGILTSFWAWWSSAITYSGATGTLCSFDVYLVKVGTPDSSRILTFYLYSDLAGVPDASLGTIGTITMDVLGAGAWHTIASSAITVTNGAAYHIVMFSNYVNASNYAVWRTDNTCAVENVKQDTNGVAPWTDVSTTNCGTFKLYTLE